MTKNRTKSKNRKGKEQSFGVLECAESAADTVYFGGYGRENFVGHHNQLHNYAWSGKEIQAYESCLIYHIPELETRWEK